MKKIIIAVIAFALVGCLNKSAPAVDDVKNIVIEGTKYTSEGYIKTFCETPDMVEDPNCQKVRNYQKEKIENYYSGEKKSVEW